MPSNQNRPQKRRHITLFVSYYLHTEVCVNVCVRVYSAYGKGKGADLLFMYVFFLCNLFDSLTILKREK